MKRTMTSFLLIALMAIPLIALSEQYRTLHHGVVTSTVEIAADSTSCETKFTDSSDVDWLEMKGNRFLMIFRYKVDTVFETAVDSLFAYIQTSPVKGYSDSANLYRAYYSFATAAPGTTYTYDTMTFTNADVEYHHWWKVFMVSTDSLGSAGTDSALAGNDYDNYLEYWIEEYGD